MKQPLDHLRSKKKPVRKTVWIAGDSELADELSELEASLSRARTQAEIARPDRREAALQTVLDMEAEYEAKKAAVRESSIKFVMQGIRTKDYDDLIAAHPPTEEQLEKLKAQGETDVPFDVETFPYALIAATCVEPDVPKEDLIAWLHEDSWNRFEILTLFNAANEVNQTRRIINLGKD